MYKKVITMTGFKRPDYTKQVLDSLRQCIGFDEYTLLPTIEPGYPDVINLFNDIPNCELIVNNQKLGCSANTLKALQRGFDISDFVIHLEDDTVPGIDCLQYMEWINQTYKNDKDIFTASAYNRISSIDTVNYFSIQSCPYFTGWIWSTWNDRFEEMKNNWNFRSWDTNINRNIRGDRLEITPSLPRSKNIGEYDGTYATPKLWREQQYSPIWVNDFIPEISNTLKEYKSLSNILNELNYKDYQYQNVHLYQYPYHEIESKDCPILQLDPKVALVTNLCIFGLIKLL